MCIHKRIVFACNHFVFTQEVRPCEVEVAFLNGHLSASCDTMFAHPLHSVLVQKQCRECAKKKLGLDKTTKILRIALSELREIIEHLERKQGLKQPSGKLGELEVDSVAEETTSE
jgi:hypothetical protein